MNKTVRSLRLLYRCYGRTVCADALLELFADGTPDVSTQRRTLRRYLADFRAAGIPAAWNGRGAAATVSIPLPENTEDLGQDGDAARELVEILRRRLKAEQEANNVFRNLLLRRTNRA